MKKIILLLLLVLVSVTASARKSYITVQTPYSNGRANESNSSNGTIYIILSGDVPNDIEGFRYVSGRHYWESYEYDKPQYKQYSTGEILSLLSEYGYEVEYVIDSTHFLLSKEISSGQTQIEGDVNHDSEVNIADVNRVISLILDKLRENPKLLEQLGIVQPK